MTLNSVHNIKNKEYVQTTCLSLFSIKLVKKMKMTTLPPPPVKTSKFAPLYYSKETDHKSLETFIKKTEKDLFNPEHVKKSLHEPEKR